MTNVKTHYWANKRKESILHQPTHCIHLRVVKERPYNNPELRQRPNPKAVSQAR